LPGITFRDTLPAGAASAFCESESIEDGDAVALAEFSVFTPAVF